MTLEIRDVSYYIGPNCIVDRVSGVVRRGEILALVGLNGAGKSTLAALASGLVKPDTGDVKVDGVKVSGKPFAQVARLGIARMFQAQHLAWNLTVKQNLLVALRGYKELSWWEALSAPLESEEETVSVWALLERVGIADVSDTLARELSFGQMRLLAMARVLAHPGDFLLMDEPFTGLKGAALLRVQNIIKEEKERGRGVWLIDHLLSAIEMTADRIWFMHRGSITEYPSFVSLTSSEAFLRHYLGGKRDIGERSVLAKSVGREPAVQPPLLRVRGVAGGYANREIIEGADLEVRPSEVVGIIGPNGSGKSTLLRIIAGLAQQTSGSISLADDRLDHHPIHARIRMGLRFLPQEGKLLATLTVSDNEVLSRTGLQRSGTRHSATTTSAAGRWREWETRLNSRAAGSLSGGEQAQLALTLLGSGRPRLLLLDEPTSGVDAVAEATLESRIAHWSSIGIATIIVEHDIPFLLKTTHRLYHLRSGFLVPLGETGQLTSGAILATLLH